MLILLNTAGRDKPLLHRCFATSEKVIPIVMIRTT